MQHSTIQVYLSAICSLHIEQGFPDRLVDCLRLQRVLRGIKRTQGIASSLRLPEFTVPNLASYAPAIHLGVANIAVGFSALMSAYQH